MRLKVHEKSTARETGKIEQDKPDNTWNPSPVETDDFVEQFSGMRSFRGILREVLVQLLQREY